MTTKRLTEQLKEVGYTGGYDAVRRYAQRWRQEHSAESAAAFVPLIFPPGDYYFANFDVQIGSGGLLIDNAAGQEHQIALLWHAIEKLSGPQTASARDCVPKDAALEETFEADKLNQLMGK